jgi:hypothetical protein
VSRYSQLYIERGTPLQDSKRMRKRLAALVSSGSFETRLRNVTQSIGDTIKLNQGCDVPYGMPGYRLDRFLESAEMRDVLDAATVIISVLRSKVDSRLPVSWQCA